MKKIKLVTSLIVMFALIFSSNSALAVGFNIVNDSKQFTLNGYDVEIKEDMLTKKVIVKNGNEQSVAVFNKTSKTLLVDNENVNVDKLSVGFENHPHIQLAESELLHVNEYRINIAGMSVGAIVAAIVATLTTSVAASVLASIITSALADNAIKRYISIREYTYWDPSTINQQRPRFWTVVKIYSGYNFDKLLVSI